VNGPAQKAQQIVGAVALSFCLDQLYICRRGSFWSDSAAQLNSMLDFPAFDLSESFLWNRDLWQN
jgi:hypothetical protein